MAFGCALSGYDRASTHIHQLRSSHWAEAGPPENDDLCKVIRESTDRAKFGGNYKQSQV